MAVPHVGGVKVDAPADSGTGSHRVLFVAAFFPPWGGVGAMRLTKLIKYLPGLGWQPAVICSDERAPEIRDDTLLDEVPGTVVVRRVAGPLGSIGSLSGQAAGAWRSGRGRAILGLAKGVIGAFAIPDRWIGWSARVGSLPARTLASPDVVVSSGPPHSAHFAAARIARRLRVPFVMDLRDDWYRNPMHASSVPWRDPIEGAMERWCLMRASRVVVVSDAAVTILVSRYPALEGRVFAIPNGFDPDDLDPTIEHVAVPAGQVVDFLFAGTLRRGQTVGRFFEAFGVFARTNPEARLSLLGVVDSDHVTRARAAVPPSAFRLMAPLRHREAIAAMSRAGVLVVFTGQGGAGAATMTGKLYEYLAARRPILLVGPHGPAAELVRSAGAGVTADPDDVADLARGMEAALQLARDPAYVGAPAEILDRYDRRSLARAWAALLGDVLGARS